MLLKYPEILTAFILAGQNLSSEINISHFKHIGLIMPADWTAANLTLQVATRAEANGGIYMNLFDDGGSEVTLTAAAARAIAVASAQPRLAPWSFLRLRSGTAAAPVNQVSPRIITIVLKD